MSKNTLFVSVSQLSALSTLCYFDIFNYPLNLKEIACFSAKNILLEDVIELKNAGIIKEDSGFYYLSNSNINIQNRIDGNNRAKNLENKAIKQAKFIGSFPFVRSVSLSGSISKGYLSEDADLDFFIITTPKRLWLARTLLILYKKAFLLNSRKYFCVNYFVDTNHLAIEEENLFTGTELVTLRNVYGRSIHDDLMESNEWVESLFPNHRSNHLSVPYKPSRLKEFFENMLSSKLGDVLDETFMKLTVKRWKNQFNGMEQSDFELAFKSRKYVSKHHPKNYQKYVLDEIQKRKELISNKFGIEWE